jgi:tRNA G18 (ribose-2'-O)-methylase SpoU
MRKLSNRELNRKHVDEFKHAGKTKLIVILDNVRSLLNIGSVFRTSDAFLIEGIYLTGICAKPPHRDIEKAALGATDSICWEYFDRVEDAAEKIKAKGYQLILIEQTDKSISLPDFYPDKEKAGLAIVFGNEVKGVSESLLPLSDAAVEVPQFGSKHSFNIAVCAGIVIYDLYHKLENKKA